MAPPTLTPRELEALRFLACGMRNATIAESLGIKHTTVRNHVEHILGKLGVHSRLEAVVFAAEHRLVWSGTDQPRLRSETLVLENALEDGADFGG